MPGKHTLFIAALVALCAAASPAAIAGEAQAAQTEASAQTAKPVDDRVILKVSIPEAASTGAFQRSQLAIFNEYVKTHPEVNVIASEGLVVEGFGNSSQLLQIAGGIAPDVFPLYYQQAHSYIEQGFVAPLDEYLDKWEDCDKVPPQCWPVVTGPDGRRYGAIVTWPTIYLVYRKDFFEEAGLDPNRAPATWDELFEYAKRLSKPDLKVETALDPAAGFGRQGMFLQTSGSWIFSNFVWQAGGDVVRKRDDGRWEACLNSPEAIAALEFYKKLRWTKWERDGREYTGVLRTAIGGTSSVTYDRMFARGEVAMAIMPLLMLQWVLDMGMVRPDVIGVAPLPAGPGGRASIIDGDFYSINSAIMKDKRKMDAAWEYIRFLCSDKAKEVETKTYVEMGLGRFVRNPHWLEQFGYKDYFEEIDPQQLAAYDDALKYGHPEPFCPNYGAMGEEMNVPVSRVLRDPDADPATELREINKRINTFHFKLYPEEQMRFRRKVFAVGGVGFLGVLCVIGYFLFKTLSERVASAKSNMALALKASRWKHIYAWIFLLPAVATILLWSYTPLVRGSLMSFQDYKIMGGGEWIGWDNFIEAVSQPMFWGALKRTLFYSSLTLTFGFFTPICLALLLSEVPRLKITFRLLFYLPALTSGLVLMFLWKDLFFNPSPTGLLNQFVTFFGLGQQTWLQDPGLAMFCIILPGVWAGAGPGSIIYLAALTTVPDDLYEAAEMDGANVLQKIYLVTLPYLKPLIIINFFGAFIGSFQATQNIFVMTMGGPENATRTLSLEIFFNAFLYLKFGYATAMAWIMGSMLIGFTLYQLRIFQRVQFTTGASAARTT